MPLDVSSWSDVAASKTRLYVLWEGMRQRCYDPNHHTFKWYGAKGVSICEEWRWDFVNFAEWALKAGWKEPADHKSGPRKYAVSIDRINTYGNYEPGNCRLSNPKQQNNNRANCVYLTAFGTTQTATEWEESGRSEVTATVLCHRAKIGMEHHRALMLPAHAPTSTTRRNGSSQYLGVSFHSQSGRWQVNLQKGHVGIAGTEEEAARIYDTKAREAYGEWAILNFPEEWPDPLCRFREKARQ